MGWHMTASQAAVIADNSTIYATAERIVGFIGEEGVRAVWQDIYEDALANGRASDYSQGALQTSTPTTKE